MWTMKFIIYIIIFTLVPPELRGEKQGHGLCDVAEWHTRFLEHIDSSGIDLRGWQASYLREIRYLVQEYGDRKVLKPCSLLDTFQSYILDDDGDEEKPDFNEIDIDNYSPIVPSSDAQTDKVKENNIDIQNNSDPLEQGHEGTMPVDSRSPQIHSDNIEMNKEIIGETSNERSPISNYQHKEGEDFNMEIDPTDLSFLDYEEEEEHEGGDDDDEEEEEEDSKSAAGGPETDRESHDVDIDGRGEELDSGHQQDEHREEKQSNDRQDSREQGVSNSNNNDIIECGENLNDISNSNRTKHTLKLAHNNKCDYLYHFNIQMLRKMQQSPAHHRLQKTASEEQIKTNEDTEQTLSEGGKYETTKQSDKSESELECDISSENIDHGLYTKSMETTDEQEYQIHPEHPELAESDHVKSDPDDHKQDRPGGVIAHNDAAYGHRDQHEGTGSGQEKIHHEIQHERARDRGELNEDNDHENIARHTIESKTSNEDNKKHLENLDNNDHSALHSNYVKTPEFESLLAQQEQQTTHKIDELKLNLVSLENKFLMQSIAAKDDVISTQNLEKHILGLENELYRLNQSYNRLQRDHGMLKRKQKEQNSSIMQYHDKLRSCPPAQPKSENNFQLITQQKSRIWELSQVVANQSMTIQQIQSRSWFLEEQNRQLFKVVMDQSALISNILSQVQEIGENNANTKLETIELKTLFNQALESKKQEESNNKVEDFSRFSDNNNDVDGSSQDSVETLPDSAFIPLETIESTGDNDINFDKLEEKSISQQPTENQHEKTSDEPKMPSVGEDIEGDVGKYVSTNTVEAEKVPSSSGHDESGKYTETPVHLSASTPPTERVNHEETSGAKIPDSDSSEKEETKSPTVPSPKVAIKMAEREEQTHKEKETENLQPHRLLYPTTSSNRPSDCYDLHKKESAESGINKVFVSGLDLSVSVFCDELGGSGGWTVLLKRDGGQVDFYRTFEQYRDGFGTPRSEHYLGNEAIHYLTNQKHYSLRVELTDWEGNTRHALYDQFWIDSEDEQFKLHVHGYSGTAGDGLAKHHGMKFSTSDVDNDLLKKEMGGSCAKRFRGAGWYYKCYQSNLMGVFYENGVIPEKRYDGITWKPWKGPNYSMKSVSMSIRPRDTE